MRSQWTEACLAVRRKEGETLADLTEVGCALRPDAPAVYFEGRQITFRELDDQARRVAAVLLGLGVQPGDRVAVHLDNRPEFIAIFLGVMRAGGILVPTNVMYTAEEMEHILADSGASVLLVLGALAPKLRGVRDRLHALRHVIEIGNPALDNSLAYARLLAEARPDAAALPRVDPGAVAILQYTSGTTGHPKGAMVTHANVLAVLDSTANLPGGVDLREEDVTLLVLPLFHSYALNFCLGFAFLHAQPVVLVGRFDAERVFGLFEQYRVTLFYGAPPMYHAFVHTPGLERYDVSSLRGAFSGAAPLPVVILERFRTMTGVEIVEGYGLSETAPVLTSNAAGPRNKVGAVGPPIPGVRLRVVDDDDRDVAPGEVGEIVAQGPNIFKGYWNQPEETRRAMRGGWFHTGDLARVDEDGYYYIVDRKKDMIIVSGFNVYPIELENVILRHPKVADCAVIGAHDSYKGEAVKACVVLRPSEQMSEEELVLYCREHLAAFKVPKYVSFRESLPKTLTGKVLKRVLRAEEEEFSSPSDLAAERLGA
ncbi:MAG: long-chain fatty acid--CoA ligase [Candidatus Hydrogenedentes bacterium]|nr:long-chain fatty acid--CoA ligase [Candidatus Hydrogenedentota bacterium]